jgi:hypothetical protein
MRTDDAVDEMSQPHLFLKTCFNSFDSMIHTAFSIPSSPQAKTFKQSLNIKKSMLLSACNGEL